MTKNLKYYLGLDLGISSVGWAVMAEDVTTGKHTLHDFGVRLFDVAEESKTKTSLATKRREFRSTRRLIRRRFHRLEMLKRHLNQINLFDKQAFIDNFQTQFKVTNKIVFQNNQWTTESGYFNPYVLKAKGLDYKLSKDELYVVLINYAKKRGYADKFSLENDENQSKDDKTTKAKTTKLTDSANKASELIKKYQSIAKAVIQDSQFHLSASKTTRILFTKNSSKLVYKKSKSDQYKKYIDVNSVIDKKQRDELSKRINFRHLFDRQDYQNEAKAILLKQKQYYPKELTTENCEKIINIIFQSRDFEMGAKCNDCTKVMIDSPDSYQNQLHKCKNKHCSNFGIFWDMTGKCHFYPTENRGTKASILFTVFYYVNELSKIWNILANHKLILTPTEKQSVLQQMLTSDWKDRRAAIKLIQIAIQASAAWKIHGNKDLLDSKKIKIWQSEKSSGLELKRPSFFKTCWETSTLKSFLTKIIINEKNIDQWEKNLISQIGSFTSRWITPHRRKKAIENLLNKFQIKFDAKTMNQFLSPKLVTSPANVSFQFMKEAIQAYLKGINFADFQAEKVKQQDEVIQTRFKKNSNSKKLFAKFTDLEMTSNPVVFRAINQTRLILKALHKKYNQFENIAVEVGRDIYKSAKDRNKIEQAQDKNLKKKIAIIQKLAENNIPQNQKTILAYLLWEQQNKQCIYSGKTIDLKDINPADKMVEIDHIIPRSWSADDSRNNKVLVLTEENQQKGQQIPYQYLKNNWKIFTMRIHKLENYLGKTKTNYLLAKTVEEAVEGFASRNLNDTRYISKYIYNYLLSEFKNHQIKTNVFAVVGQVISRLRRKWLATSAWGLDQKVRDISPFHHAIDASILCQFKKKMDIELAVDLIKLKDLKTAIERFESEGNPTKLTNALANKNAFMESIKNKIKTLKTASKNDQKKRFYNVNEYMERIYLADRKNQFVNNLYIDDFQNQLEKRIPVELEILDCKCFDTETKKILNLACQNCNGSRKLPKYVNVLNEAEWKTATKHLDTTNIDLHYPHISRMVRYKVRGPISSSENLGFKKGKAASKPKNLLFKKWKLNNDVTWNEMQAEFLKHDLNQTHFRKWVKEFINKESYLITKAGGILQLDTYYGVYLPKNKSEKVRFVRMLEAKNDKELYKKYDNFLINNRLIEYFDDKLQKRIIKFYSGKSDNKLLIFPNALAKADFNTSQKDYKFVRLVGINNILKNNWKFVNVNLLGKQI